MADLQNIRTITFDMDDTLWDFQSAMTNALAITLERLRSILPGDGSARLTVPRLMEIRDGVALEMGEGTVRQEEIRYAAMVKTLQLLGSADRGIADELFGIYMDARLAGAKPFDDVPDVGDSLESDVQGANHHGMLSIWLNRNAAPNETGITPHREIRDFAELLDLFGMAGH